MPIPIGAAIIAGGAFSAAGSIGGALLGGGGEVKSQTRFSGKQLKVQKALLPHILSGLEEGATKRELPLFSEEELASLDAATGAFTDAQAIYGDLFKSFKQVLSGAPSTEIDEQSSQMFFEKSIAVPLLKTFSREIVPAIRRGYKGFTSREGLGIQKAYADLADTLSVQLSSIMYQDEQARRTLAETASARRLQALGIAPSVLGLPMNLAGAYGGFASQFQARRLEEESRLMPESNPWLSMGFSFLDQQHTFQYQTPETLGPLGLGLAGASAGLNVATSYANLFKGTSTTPTPVLSGSGASAGAWALPPAISAPTVDFGQFSSQSLFGG